MDRTVKIWNTVNGTELMTLRGHESLVRSVAFSPDGRRIVSGSSDETLKVWDAENGDELITLRAHSAGVYSVAFSPDGRRIVSGSRDNTVKIWDAATGDEIHTMGGHKGVVRSVSFNPDGKHIVSGSEDNGIKIWDVTTGSEIMTLHGREGTVESASFSPDGKRIVFAGDDGVIKICDSATGADLMTLRIHDRIHDWPIGSVVFSPDGKSIAASDLAGRITLWESSTPADGYGPRWHAEAARKVVYQLYEEQGSYQEVIDNLKADKVLDEQIRDVALQIANACLWEDAKKPEEGGIDRISQYVNQGRYEEAKALLVKALEGMRPGGAENALMLNSLDKLASLYVRKGHYEEARQVYVKTVELSPNTPANSGSVALLQLYTGDIEGYRKTCAWMLDHFAQREELDYTFGSACWACSLAPDAVEDLANALKLAEKLAEQRMEQSNILGQAHNNLGALLYRAGRFEEAIELLEALPVPQEEEGRLPVRTSPPVSAWFFLAMAHHQLDQHEEAEKWLAKANERVELEMASNPRRWWWGRPLVHELLQAEAKQLLGESKQ
jgi:tetratricopeptide (TPR) repeat protein